jgi:uncharacterized SAM-binding protein YcdF (DUF218 family)
LKRWVSKTWVKVLFTFVLLAILGLFLYRPILLAIGNFLVVNAPPQKADGIKVLGGNPERYIYGVELYRAGFGPRLLLSLNKEYNPLLRRTNAEIVKEFTLAEGIPRSKVSISSTTSTYEEANTTKRLAEEEEINSLLLVSSPFHMRRVSLTFSRVLGNKVTTHFVMVPFKQSKYKREWWLDEDSISLVIQEYIKLGYYWFKYFAPF